MEFTSIAPIDVPSSVEQAYGYWKNPYNYALFMTSVSVEVLSPNELSCTAKLLSSDTDLQWYCDIVADDSRRQIRWKTYGAITDFSVVLRFEYGKSEDTQNSTRIHAEFAIRGGITDQGNERLIKRQLMTDLRTFREREKEGVLQPGPPARLADNGQLSPAKRFEELAAEWRQATSKLSNLDHVVGHPSYQAIIAMGDDVVPILLHDLQREPDLWFYALGVITGISPVQLKDAGNLPRMAQAWIAWGQEQGFIAK